MSSAGTPELTQTPFGSARTPSTSIKPIFPKACEDDDGTMRVSTCCMLQERDGENHDDIVDPFRIIYLCLRKACVNYSCRYGIPYRPAVYTNSNSNGCLKLIY